MRSIAPRQFMFEGYPFWKSLIERLSPPAEGRAYIVGGWVRDILLYGQPSGPVEMDLALEGDAVRWARSISSKSGLAVRKESDLGTASLDVEHLGIHVRLDFASCRKDRYPIPGALPLISPAGIVEDLFRRDFSVNAMAIEVPFPFQGVGHLLDPCDGRRDIAQKNLRIMHDKSFIDDPTRMFRLLRFARRLGFSIDPDTETAFEKGIEARCLSSGSKSRIWDEVRKILSEPDPMGNLLDWLDSRLLTSVADHLVSSGPRRARIHRWGRIFQCLPRSGNDPKFIRESEFLLALLFGLPKGAFGVACDFLGIPGRIRKKLAGVLYGKGYRGNVHRFWERTGGSTGRMRAESDRMGYESACLLALRAPSELAGFWENYFFQDVHLPPLVTGEDLVRAGVPASSERERLLSEVRRLQRLGRIVNKTDALNWIEENRKRKPREQ